MMLMPNIQETANTNMKVKAPSSTKSRVLLRADGLKKTFGGQMVLDCVDLELRQGEVVLLRGENGSGKTTLLNILTGNLEPDTGVIHYSADHTPRTYYFPRRWWQELNPFDHFTPEFVAREGVGRTWQDVRLFGSQSLRNNIAVATPGHPGENPLCAMFTPGTSAKIEKKINEDVEALLSQLGLSGREDSSADKISLGQSKRVAIARAVAAGAKILFLDEPLAGLDRQGITDVLVMLENLVRDHDVTLVIIEHIFNQAHLQDLVNADWLLVGGRLQRNGAKQKISARKINVKQTCLQRPDWFQLIEGDDAEIIDEPLPHGALLTRIRRTDRFITPPSSLLEVQGLVVNYGIRTVVGLDDDGNKSGFNLTLYKGEIAILQAPNGWGKSSLFTAITGLIQTERGRLRLNGRSIDSLPAWTRVRIGIRALLSDSNFFQSLLVREAFELAGSSVQSFNHMGKSHQTCGSLSGGEAKENSLLCHLAVKRNTLIHLLDEPFRALDAQATTNTINKLLAATKEATMLFAIPSGLSL